MSSVTPGDTQEPPAHPFAVELAEYVRGATPGARVLVLGIGSGRNLPPLVASGASIDVVEADATRARDAAIRLAAQPRVRVTRGSYGGPFAFAGGFAAALSTHALLHGTTAEIERAVAAIADRLALGGALFATFGSTRDPRFVAGEPIDAFASAPREGDERGVTHAYFDEPRLRAMLHAFTIEGLEEASASETAGRWAHDAAEARAMIHWFVRAKRKG